MQLKLNTLAVVAVSALAVNGQVSEFISGLSAISSDASAVSASVSAFNSAQGLLGALSIQSAYNTLSSDVASVNSIIQAADDYSDSDKQLVADNVGIVVDPIVGLLNALVEKYNDINAVLATSIVKNDLEQLQPIFNSIQSKAYAILPSSIGAPVASQLASINSAFGPALSQYGATSQVAPSPTY